MLCGKTKVGDVIQNLCEQMPLFATDNKDNVALVRAKILESRDETLGRECRRSSLLHHLIPSQTVHVIVAKDGTTIIQQNKTAASILVFLCDLSDIERVEASVHTE